MKKKSQTIEPDVIEEIKASSAYKVAGIISLIIFVLGIISKQIFNEALPSLEFKDYFQHFFFSLSLSVISVLIFYRIKNDTFEVFYDLFYYAAILVCGEVLSGLFDGFTTLRAEWDLISAYHFSSVYGVLINIILGIFITNIKCFGLSSFLTSVAVGLLGPWILFKAIIETGEKLFSFFK